METDNHILHDRKALIGQVIRFGISGIALTVAVAGSYWAVADLFQIDPNVSLAMAYVVFTFVGFMVHSQWSFKGHGSRDRVHVRTARFFITNGLGFLSNQFFVWLLVKQMGGPTWWPIIPIVLITPVLTFTLNRKWVFG